MALDSTSPPRPPRSRMRARLIGDATREPALRRLSAAAQENLLLLDLVGQIGRVGSPSEVPAQALGAWADDELLGIAALRPSLVLEAGMPEFVLDALLPYFEAIETGLVKSARPIVDLLWRRLERRGKRSMIDRIEHALVVRPGGYRRRDAPPGVDLRPAAAGDLEALVHAARASLREEGRPDPFDGDPSGFRRWVGGRLARARVAEAEGEVCFVGYADVRRSEGWLVQGVYTWPGQRQRGVAGAGMSALVDEAFASGAEHVQLAVVAGNTAGLALYDRLGFAPFDELRTILFY